MPQAVHLSWPSHPADQLAKLLGPTDGIRVVARWGDAQHARLRAYDQGGEPTSAELTPTEGDAWTGLRRSEPRRHQWLAGRLAVKDAVLECVATGLDRVEGVERGPARSEVQIGVCAGGGPVASLVARPDRPVLVSLSHTRELVVAVAAAPEDGLVSLGVDIESPARWPVICRGGLTVDERVAVHDRAVDPRDRARAGVGLWCAKEAAVKAWRTGFDPHGGPRAVRAAYLDEGHRVRVLPGSRLCHLPPATVMVTAWSEHVAAITRVSDNWRLGTIRHGSDLSRRDSMRDGGPWSVESP